MRLVLTSWDAGAADGGLSRQTAELASGLRRRGVEVVVVTREGSRAHRPLDARRVVVPDLPPAVQGELRGRVPESLAFANRAVPHLVAAARPDDVLVVEGWQTALAALPAAAVDDLPVLAVLDGLEGVRQRLGDDPDGDGQRVRQVERDLAARAAAVLWRGLASPDAAAAALQVPVPRVRSLPLVATVPDRPVVHRHRRPRLVATLPPRGASSNWSTELSQRLDGHEVRDLRRHDWPADRPPDVLVVHDVERGDVAVHALAVGIPLVVGMVGGLPDLVSTDDPPGPVAAMVEPGAGPTAAAVAGLLDDPATRRGLATRAARHAQRHHAVDLALEVLLEAARQAVRSGPGPAT